METGVLTQKLYHLMSLPIYYCNGTIVNLTVGEKVHNATQPTYRFAGNLIVYASNPWFLAAKAVITNLDYKILSAARVKAGKFFMTIVVKVCEECIFTTCTNNLWRSESGVCYCMYLFQAVCASDCIAFIY